MDKRVEQLMALRTLSRIGVLHEAQIEQLRYWPVVVAPHATSYEVVVADNCPVIEFIFKVAWWRRWFAPRDFKDRIKKLDESVKWLLGDDWCVVVRVNGAILLKGKPEVQDGAGRGAQ